MVAETRNDGARNPRPDARPPRAVKAAKERKGPKTLNPAADNPVARIAVDIPLAHLDRPFDYLVPERLAAQACPGVRVRVRFAGQLTDGFVLERADVSEHQGRLNYLERVVSPEPVLTPEIAGLARAVADRYAGTLADVLRLAIPPRHAATETARATKAARAAAGPGPRPEPDPGPRPEPGPRDRPEPDPGPRPEPGPLNRPEPGPWDRYPAGRAFLDAVSGNRPARAAWTALPGMAWPEEIARAAATCASAGRGTVIVVPDARDLARVDEALTKLSTGSTGSTSNDGNDGSAGN